MLRSGRDAALELIFAGTRSRVGNRDEAASEF